jgi:D-xylose transport system permease protein
VAFAALGLVLLVVGFPPNAWLEMLLAVCVGAVIGTLTGFLVAKFGMPAFVVTLALFIAWQGVILQLIGEGGTLGLRDPVLVAVANGSMSTVASWLLFLVAAGGYAAVLLIRQVRRRKLGLVAQPDGLVLIKVGAVVVLAAIATFVLTLDRSPGAIRIAGVPYVVPIVLVILVAGTYILDRTRFGRHVYAVGGNREAARRAGIDVVRIRATVFVISSVLAAVGAIIYSSKVGSVSPSSGGGNTLLFAVGAAVIGGTSLFGGRGRISNAVIGGAVLATVNNGLGLLGQPASVVFLVNGVVLLLAAGVDVLSRRRSAVAGR